MGKIFTNENDFNEYLDNFIIDLPFRYDLYVIMRTGYTKKELLNSNYSIERLEYNSYYDEFRWDNDWAEGQKFIEVYKIITERDILTAFTGGE